MVRLATLSALAALLSACGATAADNYRGGGIALRYCVACHVIDERGTGPLFIGPPPFTEIATRQHATPKYIYEWLSTSHTRMPDMKLSRRDKADLIAYILSLRPLR
jgi:mono/diheme cytochrome c family protein